MGQHSHVTSANIQMRKALLAGDDFKLKIKKARLSVARIIKIMCVTIGNQ